MESSPPVSRDPRLRLRQPSHAEEPAEEPESEEEEYEQSSDEEEEGGGGPAEEHPTSQYRGVGWDKRKLQWEVKMAAAKAGKDKIWLGYFDFEDEEDAARMYDRGQIAYLGRKAYVEAYQAGRRYPKQKVAYPNFPLAEYSHELDWLEGLGVVDFAALLKAARAQLRATDKQVTAEATLEVAKAWQGQPSSGPQQHGASDTAADEEIKISQLASPTAEDEEEIEIRKLAREGTPPPPPRPAAGQASRPKRSRPAPQDTPAAKRRKPAAAPAAEAAAIAELRRDVREAELKTAGLASFSTHLRQLNASLLVGNAQKDKQLQALLANNASLLASNAQKDKQLQAQHEKHEEQLQALHEKLDTQQEKLIAHLLADSPDLRRVLSREGAE